MNKLVEEIIKPILENNPNIKKVVGVYGGRFQPFGPHHLKTYKWLQSKVDEAYITTSNIKKPPRHPMNFKEKVRHMTNMGVKAKYIIEEKSPYVAKNLAKKYDEKSTAFVYVFGAKDAGRLGGGGKYFQDYKKNKKNLKGFDENGYYLVAPHVKISVGGKEVSGTTMRELLGSDKFDDKERKKLFKQMFGYFNQGIYNMMTNKFKKLFESADMEFKPTSMYYVPSKKKKLKPKFKDGEDTELLKGWIEEGVPTKVKKVLSKYVPNSVISNNTKLIAWIQKNPMIINQLIRLATEEKIEENVSSSQLKQVERYLDKLWGKVGIDVEFTRHFLDRVNDRRNKKPINSAEVLRIFKQTYKKYRKQIPKLGDDAQAVLKDMSTDVNVPFALHWNGKELELRAKTIMRKKNFKSSNKKFAVEGVDLPIKVGDIVMMGRFKNKKVKVKSIDYNEKGDLLINGRPALKFRILKKDVDEDVNIVKKKGKDGGDYRDYDAPKDSDFEEPYKHIEEFLTTIDMKKIIEESLSSTNTSVGGAKDDGPRYFFGDEKSYKGWNNRQAAKLGFEVVDYIFNPGSYKMVGHETDYPKGPTGAVTYFPAGSVGQRAGTNIFGDSKGLKAFNLWDKHIKKVSLTLGYEFLDYLSAKLSVYSSMNEPMKPGEKGDESAGHTDSNRKDIQNVKDKDGDGYVEENVFTKDWWKDLIKEEKIHLDEGVKFNNFLKDWSKKSKQPLSKVNKSMNNKNTFAVAKLNDFSVDKLFDSAKKGFKTYQKIINYVPDKVAKVLQKTKFGKEKDKALGKLDNYLQKHPKLKRIMGVAAGASITYAWTKMTFVGDPEYDLDLSGAASAAAAGDYTMTDLFSGELGTKFLVLTAIGAGTGLTAPYTKILGNVGTFASGIGFGAYRAYKKQKVKKQDKAKEKFKGLPDKVKNPNPNGRSKEVGLKSAISWISKNKGNKAAKKFVRKLKTKKIKEVYDITNEVNLLTEGGAYGHMAHPFDDKDLTFGDLKKIIELGLGGNLSREDNVTEKLDGQNIMVSWKDGKLIAARNKGHIKNGGKTALDTKGIISKFKGRGDIRDAFVFAMKDLEKAIKSLSQKQKDKIFNNGYNFMNMEVMWPKSANVIDYDKAELVFHGALRYDDSGKVLGEVPGSGRILAGMIKQRNKNIGKKYKIGKPVFLQVPKHQDFGTMKSKFIGKLNKLRNEYGLKDNDTLALYHQSYWEEYIYNAAQQYGYTIPNTILENLTKRWAFFDKSYKIPTIRTDLKDESKFLEWVLKTDKENHKVMVKENMKPFETLFFEVGAEILKNVKGFMAANPDKSVQGIRKKLKTAIAGVKAGGDKKKLNTLKLQLDKLNKIGGVDAIVPSEGIVFKYKGKTYKFTGAFAPINQITGLVSF